MAGLTTAIRAEIKSLDPNLPAPHVQTLDELIRREHRQPRIRALLSGGLALTALLLAALGLYGVLSYAVVQRTQEIGIRLALGAQDREVLRMILRQGMTLTLIGMLLGIGGALALTRWLQASLYGVLLIDLGGCGTDQAQRQGYQAEPPRRGDDVSTHSSSES